MTRALRRQPQPTGSAAGGARVRQALSHHMPVCMQYPEPLTTTIVETAVVLWANHDKRQDMKMLILGKISVLTEYRCFSKKYQIKTNQVYFDTTSLKKINQGWLQDNC